MSSRAKYCSATCRSRACEGRVIPIAQPAVDQPGMDGGSEIVIATRLALREAGREATPLGLAAVELALALGSVMTPATALAGLARQFEATLAVALRGAGATSAPNALRDELAARRAQGA
jgi:hypothetical protein